MEMKTVSKVTEMFLKSTLQKTKKETPPDWMGGDASAQPLFLLMLFTGTSPDGGV